MDEKINNQILAGEITALTIDTSIFEKNSLAESHRLPWRLNS